MLWSLTKDSLQYTFIPYALFTYLLASMLFLKSTLLTSFWIGSDSHPTNGSNAKTTKQRMYIKHNHYSLCTLVSHRFFCLLNVLQKTSCSWSIRYHGIRWKIFCIITFLLISDFFNLLISIFSDLLTVVILIVFLEQDLVGIQIMLQLRKQLNNVSLSKGIIRPFKFLNPIGSAIS